MIYNQGPWLYDKYNFKVITPPTTEHISLDEARDHLRIVPFGSPAMSDEDDWLTANISVAREWCEGWSMCALCVQTLEVGLSQFPGTFQGATLAQTMAMGMPYGAAQPADSGILLPMASPLISVDSVKYDDGSGSAVVLNDFYVNDYERPARLYPASGTTWPTAQQMNRRAVRIRYTCGYSLDGDSPMLTNPIPFAFKAAMLLVLGHLHENRENTLEVKLEEIPLGAAALMSRYSCRLGIA